MAITTHQRKPLRYDEIYSHLFASNVVTTSGTSTSSHTSLLVSTVNHSGVGWAVKTYSYSYDGIVHVESYISDV